MDVNAARQLYAGLTGKSAKPMNVAKISPVFRVRGLLWRVGDTGNLQPTAAGVVFLGKNPWLVYAQCQEPPSKGIWRSWAMASDWQMVPVADVAIPVLGGTPKRSVSEYWGGSVKWASARGTVGALVQLAFDMAFNQTCYGLTTKRGVSDDYLFYALTGSLQRMHNPTYGTVFETITKKTFYQWIILLPPLPEQRAIAHMLPKLISGELRVPEAEKFVEEAGV